MKTTVHLERLSVCDCGFPLLDESIALGTEYVVDYETINDGFTFRCGGCRTVHYNMTCINASQRLHPDRPMAPLPMVIFEKVAQRVM